MDGCPVCSAGFLRLLGASVVHGKAGGSSGYEVRLGKHGFHEPASTLVVAVVPVNEFVETQKP